MVSPDQQPDALTPMELRRATENHNLIRMLSEAGTSGAHVYTLPELHPELAEGAGPPKQLPMVSGKSFLYRFGNSDYQCVLNGSNIYHHRLTGRAVGGQFVREAPQTAPWHPQPSGGEASTSPFRLKRAETDIGDQPQGVNEHGG